MFTEIPNQRPLTPLLDGINSPTDLRGLAVEQLSQLADELRAFLLYSVARSGGHFSAGLGVVELTIALHYALNTPDDRLVWDVGHQTYPHKILTGRRDRIASIRQRSGLSGFPKREESPYDTFGVGHSSTSISAALGMALAGKQQGVKRETVAIIGDGAITAGMAFEALNHAVHTHADLMVVLNDNTMSISKNVGGLASYFAKILEGSSELVQQHNATQLADPSPNSTQQTEAELETLGAGASAAALFAELGFFYVGPIDGHDIGALIQAIQGMQQRPGPRLLHVVTRKGKGFQPAENDPVGYHALNKIESELTAQAKSNDPSPRYQEIFGAWLCETARSDKRLVGITPAMAVGSGMADFATEFPGRFFDVAIAEQHAVTLAAGLACEGLKPVVAIYSTFLQRAYDQLIHDIALQNLDVLFAIDRAGLVGEDGASHAGAFDLSFLRCIPNMVVATPSDAHQCRLLLSSAYHHSGPAAVRYPRGRGHSVVDVEQSEPAPVGKGVQLEKGSDLCVLNFGSLITEVQPLVKERHYTLCDMRWAKPLDAELILSMAASHRGLVTLEENAVAGGAGSAVLELLQKNQQTLPVLTLGLEDIFYEQASHTEQLAIAGLNAPGIKARIDLWLAGLP
ncbi:1-deoxy-D-xylulose-5-phosphate synthase [Alteromonadaceae bacterium 2753L.S.0a.02]|nr:1-deoxy-D-xylulose-5-phosphate synthase [Alteromonadaceae bacterium 2753L.S.0a.02]